MNALLDDHALSPFHPGEWAVQARAGVRERIEPFARQVVRDHLTEQLQAFFPQLPFVVAAARDRRGRPWVTLLGGAPGFAAAPTATGLHLAAMPLPGDPLHGALTPGAPVGLLGIELHNRRRNRVNGRLAHSDSGLLLEVGQAFGNCPQHITARQWQPAPRRRPAPTAERGQALSAEQQTLVRAADTLFIGSGIDTGHPGDVRSGLDASHRGGSPGFISVLSPSRIRFPDFAGNNHFNTIGNLVVDPRVGLTLVDFVSGDLLQLSGRADVDFAPTANARAQGAERVVTVDIDAVVHQRGALPMRWGAPGDTLRPLNVVDRVRESADITSFLLRPRDRGPLPAFQPGQYLPLAVELPGQATPVTRTYSLSNAPGGTHWRISVKREADGMVSRHLHDHVGIGDVLHAGTPGGDFRLHPGVRPLLLASAGVGATPLLSMLHRLVATGDSRPLLVVHGARDRAQHAFDRETRALVDRHRNARLLVAYSRSADGALPVADVPHLGRVTAEVLGDALPSGEVDAYLCGPQGFVGSLRDGLLALGVPEERLWEETF